MDGERLVSILVSVSARQDLFTGNAPEAAQAFKTAFASMDAWSPHSARLVSRAIQGICNSRSDRAKLAKHLPALLVQYIRSASMSSIPAAVRAELQPGIAAICDTLTAGRRELRGREGEDIGKPYGLGEGPGGEAEVEMWAQLWRDWAKKRYTGRG